MADGIDRISADDVRLVRDDETTRRVVFGQTDRPSVTITRVIHLDPNDGNPRDVFNVEVRTLEDDWQGTTRCAFCEKTNQEVAQLIAGPTVHICNECIELCGNILAEE